MKRCISVIGLLGVLSLTACGGGSGGSGDAVVDNADSPPANSYDPTKPWEDADKGDGGGDTVVDGISNEPGTPGGPGANDDDYQLIRNQTLEIAADAGVLSNDGVEDLQASSASLEAKPSHGTINLAVDGSFIYTPEPDFTGVDTFSYTLTDQNGQKDSAEVNLTVTEEDVVDNGFTPIIASEDTRTVYVSSSEGLDSNDGLSIQAPVKTLNKAFSLTRSGYPDHVLLKRGDVWVDENLSKVKSGRSKAEPAVVAFYGESGDRPYLKTSGTSLTSYKLYNVNFIGLHIEAYKLNPDDPAFDGKTSANIRMGGDYENILFEDLKLRFVEFVIQGWEGVARNITIRRSMILDKYSPGTSHTKDSRPSGIYTDNGEGLTIEDNVWDHNGWNAKVAGAGANMYNHNMYISERNNVGNKVVVRNNIVTRGSSHGIHGRPGGLYENNFFARNAISLQMGYHGGPELSSDTFAYARNNVITEGQHMNRGSDACTNSALCTGAIWGLWVENLGGADVRVEGNIVSNRHQTDLKHYAEGIKEQPSAKYSDNIVYKWNSETQGTDQSYPDPGRTLADYNASLGGEKSFDAFIEVVRNRPLQTWDPKYSAEAINNYIRAGFGIE